MRFLAVNKSLLFMILTSFKFFRFMVSSAAYYWGGFWRLGSASCLFGLDKRTRGFEAPLQWTGQMKLIEDDVYTRCSDCAVLVEVVSETYICILLRWHILCGFRINIDVR